MEFNKDNDNNNKQCWTQKIPYSSTKIEKYFSNKEQIEQF